MAISSIRYFFKITVMIDSSVVVSTTLKLAGADGASSVAFVVPTVASITSFVATGSAAVLSSEVCNHLCNGEKRR